MQDTGDVHTLGLAEYMANADNFDNSKNMI